jgi:nucleotide-binding universal stress UspA family protein
VTAVECHLDAAGLLGDPAETIIRHANAEHCDLIVLAEPKPGVVRDWLMRSTRFAIGSVAGKVIRFARVPIMIAT